MFQLSAVVKMRKLEKKEGRGKDQMNQKGDWY
jgi:hypothetical protein